VEDHLRPANLSKIAQQGWPPVVVASVYQTGLNMMRDLLEKGVRVVGVDHDLDHEGFRSAYGTSLLCPHPEAEPEAWLEFMQRLSGRWGERPVLIPAADLYVTAMGRHAEELSRCYLFSRQGVEVQARLANKPQQYALAQERGFPMPVTATVASRIAVLRVAARMRFPCLLKPSQQRDWQELPPSNLLWGRKVAVAQSMEQLLEQYNQVEPLQPEAILQEVTPGPDDSKYCYLGVYASDGVRLGFCVVREHRAYPLGFGSASLVTPVEDVEIANLCDGFLRSLNYVGICEIEVKRDARDSTVRLIEVNPRFSGTGDCARYAGLELSWLHFLDQIGLTPAANDKPAIRDIRHVTLSRDLPAIPRYLGAGLLTWRDILRSYTPPLAFFDWDLRDWRVTTSTLYGAVRAALGNTAAEFGLRRRA
jgi:predicted ATP-grasp superfamily ATP-dependent carboligase